MDDVSVGMRLQQGREEAWTRYLYLYLANWQALGDFISYSFPLTTLEDCLIIIIDTVFLN